MGARVLVSSEVVWKHMATKPIFPLVPVIDLNNIVLAINSRYFHLCFWQQKETNIILTAVSL